MKEDLNSMLEDNSILLSTESNGILGGTIDSRSSLSEEKKDAECDKPKSSVPHPPSDKQNSLPKHTKSLQPEPDVNPTKFEKCYALGKRLQNGTYGIVFEASRLSTPPTTDSSPESTLSLSNTTTSDSSIRPTTFAVKVIDRTKLKKKDDDGVFREVAILRELSYVEHIITVLDFFVEPKYLYVVQNLAQGGDVFDRLTKRKTYTEQFARDLAICLIKAVHAIHDRHIIHRDLKPANILLKDQENDSSILLADFGFAAHIPDHGKGYRHTRCGTPAYCAPEIIKAEPYRSQVDMWSVGCILYILICGYQPFIAKNHKQLFRMIRAGNFMFHEMSWQNVSVPCKQLIANLLTVNPQYRWTAAQALESTWIQQLPSHELQHNNLVGAITELKKFVARRKLKAAVDAVRWATTANFWNPQTYFEHQIKSYDESAKLPTEKLTLEQGSSSKSKTHLCDSQPSSTSSLSQPGKFEDRYKSLSPIAKGNYATVWICENKETKEQFAVKIIPRHHLSSAHDEMVLNEVSIMQALKGGEAQQYMIQLIDFFESDEAFYIVMELMASGDVLDRLSRRDHYSEKEARDLVCILLKAVQLMHRKGIAHRDIKPQNLLLQSKKNDSKIKLCDFGFAKRVHTPQSLTHRVGTPPYVAPEILKNIPHDQRVDLWSIGITAHVLLVGYAPFHHENREELCDQIKNGTWAFHTYDWRHISPEARDLIRGLLQPDPVERWSADQALQSAWMKQCDAVLASRSLRGSLNNLQKPSAPLRRAAQQTLQWLARTHKGFASQPITSPTHAPVIMTAHDGSKIREDSSGNIEVSSK